MDKKIISFSVNDMEHPPSLEEINDSQFMKLRLRCFSNGITRHGYGFTLDTIKESAFTLLGKPLLFKYSIWTDDASSHEPDEVQCGFIPKDEADADISFEYDENLKKTFVCVNAYVWKVYQKDLVRILERDDGYKNVSVEMWLLEYDEEKKEELGYIPVYKLCYNGVTILGNDVTEACEGSDLTVVKFSADEYKKAQDDFIKKLNNSFNKESDEDSFLIQKNSENKEETMAKEVTNTATETPEVLENGTKYTTTSVGVSEYTDTYDDNGNFVESTSEYNSGSKTTVEHVEDTPAEVNNAASTEENTEEIDNAVPEKNSCESVEEKCSALEVKCSALEAELTTLKNNYTALELKCSSLEQYKTNKENEEKALAIECALNDVVDILSADEITEWRKKSLNCSTVDGFKNELKAFAFDKQKENGAKPTETLRNSIPMVQEDEPTNVWDRLAKSI